VKRKPSETAFITVTLTPQHKRALRQLAKHEGIALSTWARKALLEKMRFVNPNLAAP
jgi:predicted RNase H-like nuclease (RuvC/YqgF family)